MHLDLRAKSFLAMGECMVEMAPDAAGGGLYRMGFAGDTFNAAWYARKLLPAEFEVGFGSAAGDDALSHSMAEGMRAAGVTPHLRQVPGRTVGLYMIRLDGGERSFAYWRGESAARCLGDDGPWLEALLEGIGVVLISGITLAVLPPEGRARLCAALAAARTAGTVVAFDTNLRPRLWESPEAMGEGIAMGARVADIVLPSLDEEQQLHDAPVTAAEAAARYRAGGARLVVVKDGAGEVLVSAAGQEDFTVPPVPLSEVTDTTAAGDSFGAALLTGLMRGVPLEDAVRGAAQVAAQVVQARGALVPVTPPWPA